MSGPRIVGQTLDFSKLMLGPGSGRREGDDAPATTVPVLDDYTPQEPSMPEPGELEALEAAGKEAPPRRLPPPPNMDLMTGIEAPTMPGEFIDLATGDMCVEGMRACLTPAHLSAVRTAALLALRTLIEERLRGKVQAPREGAASMPKPARARKRAVRKASRKASRKPRASEGA